MSWQDRAIDVTDVGSSDWMSRAEELPPEISELQSGLRGAAQGASLGFADEITGGTEALLEKAKGNPQALLDLYRKSRDESRANFDAAQKANPGSYMGGELGGSLATAFVPGLNIAKGASLAARAGMASGLGGLSGLGMSNADNAFDLLADTGTGALAGGLFQGVGEKLVAPLAGKVGSWFADKGPAKALGKVVANIPEEATARYLENPKAVNSAKSLGELSEKITSQGEDSVLKKIRQNASEFSQESFDSLKPEGGIKKDELLGILEGLKDSQKTGGALIGEGQSSAYSALENLSGQIGQLESDEISQSLMKRLIQNLDSNTNWQNPEAGAKNEAFKKVRTFLDQSLKDQNPNYKKIMEDTAESSRAISEVEKAFKNRTNPDSANKFMKSVKNIGFKDEKDDVYKALQTIKKQTGEDLGQDVFDSWAQNQFTKQDTAGSRKTLLGSVIGRSTGAVGGESAGALAGFTADRYSGQAFKALLDGSMAAGEFVNKVSPYVGPAANALKEAAQRGNKSLAATHFILSQTNPGYRKTMEDLEK